MFLIDCVKCIDDIDFCISLKDISSDHYDEIIDFLKTGTNNSILKYIMASNQIKTCTTNYLIYLQFLRLILFLLLKLRSLCSLGNWMYYLVYIRLVTYDKTTTKTLIKVFSFSIFQPFSNRILMRKNNGVQRKSRL